jgi:hypothetical protein
MENDIPISDKEIIEEQRKTIQVLQTENLRLSVELRKKRKFRIKNSIIGITKREKS